MQFMLLRGDASVEHEWFFSVSPPLSHALQPGASHKTNACRFTSMDPSPLDRLTGRVLFEQLVILVAVPVLRISC